MIICNYLSFLMQAKAFFTSEKFHFFGFLPLTNNRLVNIMRNVVYCLRVFKFFDLQINIQ